MATHLHVWSKQGFFLFDSHSRSSEGFIALDGYSILMKFISVEEVQNYKIIFERYICCDKITAPCTINFSIYLLTLQKVL